MPVTKVLHHLSYSGDNPTVDSQKLASVLECVLQTGIELKHIVEAADFQALRGTSDAVNTSGDEVKKLDLLADEKLIKSLVSHPDIGLVGSEEHSELRDGTPGGEFAVFFDPLDGSSNLDAHIPVGTIFAIWKTADCTSGFPTGNKLVAAGYILYSSSTVAVLSTGSLPKMIVWDPDHNMWDIVKEELRIPDRIKCYSVNEANWERWSPEVQKTVAYWRTLGSGRYVGSMVADVHRNLLYGGIFAYPADQKNKHGKLRILYELAPLGWLYEKAGGIAHTGRHPIVEVQAEEVHSRAPIFMGPPSAMTKTLELLGAAKR